MGFLDKVKTTVQQGAVKAATATEKTLKIAQLSGDLGAKRQELERLYTKLGADVHELGRQDQNEAISAAIEEFLVKAEELRVETERIADMIERVKRSDAAPAAAPAGATCPACGAAVPAGAKFCPECGEKFS